MSTKECDLVTAAFLYVSRAIAEGDLDAMRRMRLSHSDIELFTELRLGDMQRLAISQPRSHFLDIAWKLCDLRAAVDNVVSLRGDAEIKLALIRAEASREMMAHLYEVTNAEYAGYLAMLAMNYRGGRPPKLSDADSERLWRAWGDTVGSRPYDEVSASEYLSLHAATGLSLRSVWQQAKRWANLGAPQCGNTKQWRRGSDPGNLQPPPAVSG